MSLSVELKITGDVTTPEHQAAIKAMMEALQKTVNELPGIGYQVTLPSRHETKTSINFRILLADGSIDPTPFPAPTGFMHEVKMQLGFHLNPVKPAGEGIVIKPGVSGVGTINDGGSTGG